MIAGNNIRLERVAETKCCKYAIKPVAEQVCAGDIRANEIILNQIVVNLRVIRPYPNAPSSIGRDHIARARIRPPDHIERAEDRHAIRSVAEWVEATGIRTDHVSLYDVTAISVTGLDADSAAAVGVR